MEANIIISLFKQKFKNLHIYRAAPNKYLINQQTDAYLINVWYAPFSTLVGYSLLNWILVISLLLILSHQIDQIECLFQFLILPEIQ